MPKDPNVVKNGIEIIQELINQAKQLSFPERESWYTWWDMTSELRKMDDRARNVIRTVFGNWSSLLDYRNFDFIQAPWENSPYKPRILGDKVTVEYWHEEVGKFIDWLTEKLDELRLVEMSQEEATMAKTEIKLGDGTTIYGDFVVADSIRDSFNKAASAELSDELRATLTALAKEVARMSEALPEEVAQQVARDLETVIAEATSVTPRRQWIQLSVEGLKQAAANVSDIGKPVIELASRILPLLK